MNWSFLTIPAFWMLLFMGSVLLWPRVTYLTERMRSPTSTVTPTLLQRLVLLVPGLCVLMSVPMFNNMLATGILTAGFIASYALMIYVAKQRA